MRIRTRLLVIALLPLALTLLVWLVCWVTARRTAVSHQAHDLAMRIRRGGYELDILTRECRHHPGPRTFQQWRLRFNSLVALVEEWSRGHGGSPYCALLRNETSALERLFAEFTELADREGPAGVWEARNVSSANLAFQMCGRAHEIAGLGGRLAEESHEEAEAAANSGYLGIAFVVLVFGVGLFTTARLLSTRIDRSLAALNTAAGKIGQGDLKHRVGGEGHDEIADLGRAFDAMAGNLERTTASRDAIERERAFAENVINSLPGVFYIIGLDARFRRYNDNFILVTGYTAEELATVGPLGLFAGDEQGLVAERIQQVFAEGEASVEACLVSKSGRRLPYYFTGRRVELGGEKVLIGMGLDISERKAAEVHIEALNEELKRSNRELEQFAYVASHDLQEPLRMVASYTQLLSMRYQGKLDEKADKYIRYAVDGAKRMQTLINDLLAYSRVGTRGKPPEPTECGEVLAEVMRGLEKTVQESGAEIAAHDLPVVMADRGQLGQVFQNLIGNAIKFRGEKPPRIEITAKRNGASWHISVADNGIGIDPQFHERIFTIFQRLHQREKYPGSGIGLSIVKKIVERHGGDIHIDSVAGGGSRFTFTMPAAACTGEGKNG